MATSEGAGDMQANGSRRTMLAIAATFVLVFLVALGSNRVLAASRGPGKLLNGGALFGDVALILLVLGTGVLVLLVLALWGALPRRKQDDQNVREYPSVPWWQKLLVITLALAPLAGLVTAVVLLVLSGHQAQGLPTPPTTRTGNSRSTSPSSQPSGHTSGLAVHWWILAAVAASLLLATLVWLRLRSARTKVGAEPAEARQIAALRAAVQDSLDDLEREPDARRAVVRAYTNMERALAEHGAGRKPFEAPLEYLERALREVRVSRTLASRLTELFQRARFSEHSIGGAMKREAIGALVAIRHELQAADR
jgi:membrane-associated phospholipid phosphatase